MDKERSCIIHAQPYLDVFGEGKTTFAVMNGTVGHFVRWDMCQPLNSATKPAVYHCTITVAVSSKGAKAEVNGVNWIASKEGEPWHKLILNHCRAVPTSDCTDPTSDGSSEQGRRIYIKKALTLQS